MITNEEFLWEIAISGAKDKYSWYGGIPNEVMDRIHMEMDTITKNNFTDYILIIWDIHDFCRNPQRVIPFCATHGIKPPPDGKIPIGPGRGSVGGSMVCYAIDIHECDPILFGLYFERFLNPERIAYPDIDFDLSQAYRHIVLAYIAQTYGVDRVAQIITYSTLSVKTVIADVLKSANVSQYMIDTVKSTVPDDPEIELNDMIQNKKFIDAMKSVVFPDSKMTITKQNAHKIVMNKIDHESRALVQMVLDGLSPSVDITIKTSWAWEKALDIMQRLEGMSKHESTHSAGVVISPVELESNVPLMKREGEGVLACQYDMKSLEEIGYLKMDALGLRTVDVNHNAEMMVKKWHDGDFDIRKVPFNDPKAIELIRNGDTVGIFQVESSGFTQMMVDIDIGGYETSRNRDLVAEIEKLKGLEIQDFIWIAAGMALYRPGPLDAILEGKTMVQHLIDRKKGNEPVIYLFPEEQNYLSETYGILVYQEQVMQRVRQMTGCTLGRADILRKAMGKKDEILMKEQMDWFINQAMSHNFTEMPIDTNRKSGIVNRAAEEINTFSRYGFNKAHAVEYGMICYRNAYFKANYPVAFYTALLNSLDDPKRQSVVIRDMMKHGINLLPPLINESDLDFTMTDENTIRFGLAAIKGLGEKGVQYIIDDKQRYGGYASVDEFRIRIPSTLINVTAVTALAKCGAFDKIMGGGFHPVSNRATLVATVKNMCDTIGKIKQKKGKKEAPTIQEALSKYYEGNVTYKIVPTNEDLIEYANWEKETLNYFISAHPIDAYTEEIERWTAIQDVELENLPPEFYIAGFIGSCHETIIKKEGRNKGKSMAFVTIETAFRAYEATLFPGIYESCQPYLKAGSPVVVKGKRDNYKDSITIQGVYIRHLMNTGIRDCPECHIRLNSPNPLDLMQLRQMFSEHPGITQVYLHIISGNYDITLKCNANIALNDRIIDYCSKIGKLTYKEVK